jgi:hypothetical protein
MISLKIRKELFWDVDQAGLEMEVNKNLIIERVLSLGNLAELKIIFDYYGPETISNTVKRLGYLDPKTLAFILSFLRIPIKEMKCFIKKPSGPKHWD